MDDARGAREQFDRLMDGIERAPFGEGEVDERLARAKSALTTLVDATKALGEGGLGSGVLPQVVELERARIELEVATAVADADRLRACLARLDAALRKLTETQPPAPLLEVRGLWTRGRILAALGDETGARAHFREVIEVLEPHVAEQERLRAESEAMRAALDLTDRRVRASTVLAAARSDLERVVTAQVRAPFAARGGSSTRGGRVAGVLAMVGGAGLVLLALALPLLIALLLLASGDMDAGWYDATWIGRGRIVLGLAGSVLCAWGWGRSRA